MSIEWDPTALSAPRCGPSILVDTPDTCWEDMRADAAPSPPTTDTNSVRSSHAARDKAHNRVQNAGEWRNAARRSPLTRRVVQKETGILPRANGRNLAYLCDHGEHADLDCSENLSTWRS